MADLWRAQRDTAVKRVEPLAVRMRPRTVEEIAGQQHILGPGKLLRRMLQADYPAAHEGLLDVLASRTHYFDAKGRLQALFDPHLLKMLDAFEHDDVLVAQWALFQSLANAPLMMMRTQLTEQLRRETFEEMMRRRRDADGYIIEGQGSPALLNTQDDIEPIAEFARKLFRKRSRSRAAQEALSV